MRPLHADGHASNLRLSGNQSAQTRLELLRERSGLLPRRLGRRLRLERLLGETDCLCLASGLGQGLGLVCQPLQLDEPIGGLQARSREIELLAEFTARLDCLVRRVHERAQLISRDLLVEQQPRSSRDRRTLERLLVRLSRRLEPKPRTLTLDALLEIEIELEITVVGGDHANGLLRGAAARVFAAAAA